jgi:hypothetical protein
MGAVRKFYLQLHGQSTFEALGFLPYSSGGYRMWRNPSSTAAMVITRNADVYMYASASCRPLFGSTLWWVVLGSN